MKQFQRLLLAFLTLAYLASCNLYPDDDARIDEFDAVITYYDKTVDYGDYKTYAMVDTVRQISPSQDGRPDKAKAVRNSDYILNLINTNMQARNYEKVANPNDADLIINVGAISTSNLVISGGGYPGYWYGWGSGWGYPGDYWGYPGYGYYYPYYPVTFVTEYEVGTLLIDVVDQKNFTTAANSALLLRWTAVIRGVTGLTDNADIKNRLRIDINQAFDQSEYLKSDL